MHLFHFLDFYLPRSIFTYPLLIYFFVFINRFVLSFLLPFLAFNSSNHISAFNQYSSEFFSPCLLLFAIFSLRFVVFFFFTRKKALLFARFDFTDFVLNRRLFLVSQILMYSTFAAWVIVTKGTAITEPRLAYMELRKGVGFIWALGIFSVSLNASLKLIFYRLSLRSICSNILLPYFYASKGFILSLIFPFLFFKGPLTVKYLLLKSSLRRYFAKFPLICFILLSLVCFFFIYRINAGFTNETFGVFERLANSYSSFNNANKALLENSVEFDDIKNSIYFSSFWSWVPRAVFPDKPFAYGTVAVIDYFYPGSAESGATPSIGLGLVEYLQFGHLGIIPNLLFNFELLLPFLLILVLTATSKSSYNKLKLYLFCSILIPGGLSFHIPPAASFLFSMFIFRLSF